MKYGRILNVCIYIYPATRFFPCIYICPEPAPTRDHLLTHPLPLYSRANNYLDYLLAHNPSLLSYTLLLLLFYSLILASALLFYLFLASLYSFIVCFYYYILKTLDEGQNKANNNF